MTDQLEACAWEWCLAQSCRPTSVSDLGKPPCNFPQLDTNKILATNVEILSADGEIFVFYTINFSFVQCGTLANIF